MPGRSAYIEAPLDEGELITRLKAGDHSAMEPVVRSFGGQMLATASRLVGSEDEAKECVQLAFIKAWKGISSFRADSSLRTWLHRIVTNEGLMKIRARKRRAEQSLDDHLPRFDSTTCRIEPLLGCASPASADELLERATVRDQVRDAIEQLPQDYRTIVLLRDIEGFTTSETAELLELSVTNVKVRLHRARSALKNLLEPVLAADRGQL